MFDVDRAERQRFLSSWGKFGIGDGEFSITSAVGAAISVDSDGFIHVLDDSGRIQVFRP